MNKKILSIIIVSQLSTLPAFSKEVSIKMLSADNTLTLERSSRKPRSIWIIGRVFAKPPVSVLAQPFKEHFSKRLLNLLSFGLLGTISPATDLIALETEATLDSLLASEATIFSPLPESTIIKGAIATLEEVSSEAILHIINSPIVETMALVEDSGLYPVSSYANTVMRNALIDMETSFTPELKRAILSGQIQRVSWSFFADGAQARNVIQNDVRALIGKWARNFEIGEYDPTTKKLDIRIFHRGGIDVPEEKHIFNVARRLHLMGNFNIMNAYEVFPSSEAQFFQETQFTSTEAAETAFNRANAPGKIVFHDGRNYLVTDQFDINGLRKLADTNGTRLMSGQQGHLVLGNMNGDAVAVFEENGTFRLHNSAGNRPIVVRTGTSSFIEANNIIDEENKLPPPEKGFYTRPPQVDINPAGLTENCYYASVAALLNFNSVNDLVFHTQEMQNCTATIPEIVHLFKSAGVEVETRYYLSEHALKNAMASLPENTSAGVAFTRPKRIGQLGELLNQAGHMIVGYRRLGGVEFFDFQAPPLDANFSGWRYSLPHDAFNFFLFTPK